MNPSAPIPTARDKLLFTPGPLTTSRPVKQAMLSDAGSWHYEFNGIVRAVRKQLLQLANLDATSGYECVLLQGSGTFGVEAVFSTCVPPDGQVAVLANGAYGERMIQMLQCLRIPHHPLRTPENTPTDPHALDQLLQSQPAITHIAAVHCETTTGILNPIRELGAVSQRRGRLFVVDAMSSFGALPIRLPEWGIDYLVSSANKCIEGVPGFSFVLARRQALLACTGYARSLSLDLLGQLQGFEKNGQFRYTPPTHSILAFQQALRELEAEGGIEARLERYRQNHASLLRGMTDLGFQTYLPPELQSPIITSFLFPKDPRFAFEPFYLGLSDRGFIIYPGKITQADTFRIGSIGRIFPADIRSLLAAVDDTLRSLGINTRS